MDPRVFKSYAREVPEIIIDEEKGLSDDDVKIIYEKLFRLNTNNEIVKKSIKTCPRMYPSIHGTIKPHISKTILQPLQKEYGIKYVHNNPFTQECWMIKGFSREEAIELITQERESRRKLVGHVLDTHSVQLYEKLEIDYSTRLSLESIKKLILYIDNNFYVDSDVFNNLAQKLFNEYEYPTRDIVNQEVKKIGNPSGTPGGSIQSIEYWTLRGWPKEKAKAKVSQAGKNACVFSKDFYLRKGYSEEEASEIVSNIQKQNSKYSIEHWLAKGYTKDEAEEMVATQKELVKAKQYKTCIEYWLNKGFDMTESIELAQYHKDKLKESNPTQREYWLARGYTLEESIRLAKSLNPLSIEYWRTKYDTEEEAEKARRRYTYKHRREYMNNPYSKKSRVANNCFIKLKEHFPNSIIETGVKEFFINGVQNGKETRCFYDYTDHTNKIIVEFNGKFWHSSPRIIERDKFKKELAELNGYKVFYILEEEYGKNPVKTIKKLVNSINNYIKETNNEN